MTTDLEHARTRRHEGGHLVAGRIHNRESGYIVVFGDEGTTHHFGPTEREIMRMTQTEWRAYLEGVVICDLAGAAALEVFADPDPRRGAEPDRARALERCRRIDPTAPEALRDRLYTRALDLARQHRAVIERLVVTLAANHDHLAGEQVRIALDGAFAGWPTPRFDRASELAVAVAHRTLFEAHIRGLGPDPSFRARLDLWRATERPVRSGRPIRLPPRPAVPRETEPGRSARTGSLTRAYVAATIAAGLPPTREGLFDYMAAGPHPVLRQATIRSQRQGDPT